MNKLIREELNEQGETIYKMATFDIDVIARATGGLAPTIIYLHNDQDITDEIRALRFHYENPASFIEDYPAFQAMLYQKEQQAINDLYESFSIKPKNLSTGKQILWSFGVMFIIIIPFMIAAFILK
ncbi:sodium:proton antiporter [Lysinibacillus sp. KU-BSD001]|uniref:sodium:proton antiporter n=1 Tax=Lysinibacillus sp. KU-BSD001 TaxID=3141328 RepID=UPI0036EEF68F